MVLSWIDMCAPIRMVSIVHSVATGEIPFKSKDVMEFNKDTITMSIRYYTITIKNGISLDNYTSISIMANCQWTHLNPQEIKASNSQKLGPSEVCTGFISHFYRNCNTFLDYLVLIDVNGIFSAESAINLSLCILC